MMISTQGFVATHLLRTLQVVTTRATRPADGLAVAPGNYDSLLPDGLLALFQCAIADVAAVARAFEPHFRNGVIHLCERFGKCGCAATDADDATCAVHDLAGFLH